MRSIEITTTQNVTIEYELAGLGSRILAFGLDFIIIIVTVLIFSMAFSIFNPGENDTGKLIFQILILCLVWFYTLASEVIGKGQTIGKLALGIKVVRVDGAELEFYDYFSRWAFRLLDIYFSIGAIAMLLISSTENGQRLGDIVAGTTIIRKRSAQHFTLDEILNLKSLDNYQPDYPLVRNLSEQDVILIKNILYRDKVFHNLAHHDALNAMAQKVSEVLALERTPRDTRQFLRKVISDYIVLTR